MICDFCKNEITTDFKNITDKNLSDLVVCVDCLNDNNPDHVDQQIEWLKDRSNEIKKIAIDISKRFSKTLKKLDD
tara:strand:- start:480 stop:704 length:225 start_codon:yes stop_codon:yes gene_type:complete